MKVLKLLFFKCIVVIKVLMGDLRMYWGSRCLNGILDEILIDSGSDREKRRLNFFVVFIMKLLLVKEIK